jgi:hypothetical protein
MATTEDIEKLRRKYPARLTRGRAIKLYCKELCCCGDNISWRECPITSCFLWNFRMGKEIIKKEKTERKNDSMLSKTEQKQGAEE